ncbi:MAG: hypothetical protein RBR68_13065 [Tenuifilaceae bacterium]|jgi:hypothetical protein|nr:hypothetical protein [Tenuifilaceae bacterium]
MRKKIFFVIGLLFLGLIGHSQTTNSENNKYWVDAGVGSFGTINNDITGLTLNLGFNLIHNDTQYKLKTLFNGQFVIDGLAEQYYSVGALFGKGFSWKYFQITPSVGLGVTGGLVRGDLLYTPSYHYEKDYFVSPSIPLEIDLMLKPLKFLGIGASVWADLNLKRSMYGVTLKLGVGKFR